MKVNPRGPLREKDQKNKISKKTTTKNPRNTRTTSQIREQNTVSCTATDLFRWHRPKRIIVDVSRTKAHTGKVPKTSDCVYQLVARALATVAATCNCAQLRGPLFAHDQRDYHTHLPHPSSTTLPTPVPIKGIFISLIFATA